MAISGDEWRSRFRAHIVDKLIGAGWDPDHAEAAADAEYEVCSTADMLSGYEDDPEGSAGEAMSCWEAE